MKHALITTAILTSMLTPGGAQAHPGHLAEAAGHGHWLGAAAIGAAIAIGLWAAAKGRRTPDAAGEEAEAEADDRQEA